VQHTNDDIVQAVGDEWKIKVMLTLEFDLELDLLSE